MDTLLITGGAGFIGANLVRLALEKVDDRIVILDRLTYAGCRESLADVVVDSRVDFVEGSIDDRELVERLFERHQPRAVLNLAAETHVDRSIEDPRVFVETNVGGTFELLEAARRHLAAATADRRAAFRFLHVSTDEVFGSLGETGLFSEDTRYDPSSPYSASKAAADHLVRAYHRTYGMPTLITNCSNNYGPFQFPEKLIPLMILNAVEAKDLPIYGDGSNVRDWIFVGDHCSGLLEVLVRGGPGESYNIGGGGERTNLEIVSTLCTALQEQLPPSENPAMSARGLDSYTQLITFVEDRPGHDLRYAIDASKIRRDLGWEPQSGLAEGMTRTVLWYLENRSWCEGVQGGYDRPRLGLSSR